MTPHGSIEPEFPMAESSETWQPADVAGGSSLIEVEYEGIEYLVTVVMIGTIDRAKEQAFRDMLMRDHRLASRYAEALRDLANGVWLNDKTMEPAGDYEADARYIYPRIINWIRSRAREALSIPEQQDTK